MGVADKLIKMNKQLYNNPKYKVDMEGYTSKWHKQHTGIRQGCPLSPYLFLVIMTVMFHDIHQDETLREELDKDKILGTIFDEVRYADDTIIYSRNSENTFNKYTHKMTRLMYKYERITLRNKTFSHNRNIREIREKYDINRYHNPSVGMFLIFFWRSHLSFSLTFKI